MSARALERALDHRAAAFVDERLASKKSTLGDALRKRIASSEGVYFTLAPPETPEERLYQFEAGGLLPENLDMSRAFPVPQGGVMMAVVNLLDERAARISGLLAAQPDGVCIVDDHWPAEAVLQEGLEETISVGEEAYHLLVASHARERIAVVLVGASWLWGVTAVCATAPLVANGNAVHAEELRRSAATAFEITCTAYDDEGFVGWRLVAGAG